MPHSDYVKETARGLAESGYSARNIAGCLGIGRTTVARWLNPEYEASVRTQNREAQRIRRRDPKYLAAVSARARCRYERDHIKLRIQALQQKARRAGECEVRITPEEVAVAYESQGAKCAVCGVPEAECTRRLYIDHDHATGCFRGLLCFTCNRHRVPAAEEFGPKIRQYLKFGLGRD